jgi:hypothetical protein
MKKRRYTNQSTGITLKSYDMSPMAAPNETFIADGYLTKQHAMKTYWEGVEV